MKLISALITHQSFRTNFWPSKNIRPPQPFQVNVVTDHQNVNPCFCFPTAWSKDSSTGALPCCEVPWAAKKKSRNLEMALSITIGPCNQLAFCSYPPPPKTNMAMENPPFSRCISHWKWRCAIAMLVFGGVTLADVGICWRLRLQAVQPPMSCSQWPIGISSWETLQKRHLNYKRHSSIWEFPELEQKKTDILKLNSGLNCLGLFLGTFLVLDIH